MPLIKFKYSRGEMVYYIWRSVVGGEGSAIGQGRIEKLEYDSGWFNESKTEEKKEYVIRRNRSGCIVIPECEVFRKYPEARTYAKKCKLLIFGKVIRMAKDD